MTITSLATTGARNAVRTKISIKLSRNPVVIYGCWDHLLSTEFLRNIDKGERAKRGNDENEGSYQLQC